MTVVTIPAVFPDGETYGGEEVRFEVVTGTERPAFDGDRHVLGVSSYRMPTDGVTDLEVDLIPNTGDMAGTVYRVSIEEYRWWVQLPDVGGPFLVGDPEITAEGLPIPGVVEVGTVAVGDVTQGTVGEPPSITNVGTTRNAILDFVLPPSLDLDDVGVGFATGEVAPGDQVARLRPVELAAFGPDSSGATSSDAAFIAAQDAVWASRIATDPAGTSTGVLRASITIGPGTYRITTPRALLDSHGGNKATGLLIRGAGPNLTQIIYDPTAGNEAGPVMFNDDQFVHVTFEGIEFASLAGEGAAIKPVFLDSRGSGGSKDVVFNRCRWTGWWDKVMALRGDNTNAQWAFNDCMGRSFAAVNGFLWADPASSAAPFVNYKFNNPSFALKGGRFVYASGYLGHIHVDGGAVFYEPGASTTDSILFAVMQDDVGANEAQFTVENCYVELHEDGHMLLESHWQRGAITFRNTTWNSSGPGTFDLTSTSVIVHNTNKGTPTVVFDSCGIKGLQEFHHDNTSFQGPQSRIRYVDCEYFGFLRMAEMFTFVDDGTTSKTGGRPAIEIENCTRWTGTDNHQVVSDQTINWTSSLAAKPKVHVVPFRNGDGELLRSADGASVALRRLPVGAVLSAAELYVISGGSSSTSWSFAFTDADGLVLATFATGQQLSNGLHLRIDDLDAVLSTTNKATITCVSTGTVPSGVVGHLALEYVA